LVPDCSAGSKGDLIETNDCRWFGSRPSAGGL